MKQAISRAKSVCSLPALAQTLRLPDGRQLGYAEYGDPKGKPIFFFHGLPGLRLTLFSADAIAATLGLRLIAPERPGYGLSDFQPGRTLLGWPTDVALLADALRIERFVVMGLSGGGPYALACAVRMPHRLTRCLLICSFAPPCSPEIIEELPFSSRLTYRIGSFLLAPWFSCSRWKEGSQGYHGPFTWTRRRASKLGREYDVPVHVLLEGSRLWHAPRFRSAQEHLVVPRDGGT